VKTKICWSHAIIDLAGVPSSGRLRQQTSMGEYFLKISGWDGIRSCAPMFFMGVWFQRERVDALLSVAIMGYVLWSMVKLGTESGMKAEFLRTHIEGLSLCCDEELAP
jgi:hypothetical protein